MDRSRLETKVGLFVFFGLVLLAVLVVLFSKGLSFEWQNYRVYLRTTNVGGLKEGAAVLMSGVPVGRVSNIKLAADGRTVTVTLKLNKGISIYSDAKFFIEQSGFLGDQYVAIVPTQNAGPPLKEGDEVMCEAPFNLLEVARNTSGFIARIDDAARKVDAAVTDLRHFVLNEHALSNLAVAISSLRVASERAIQMIDNVNALVDTNRAPVATTISNLVSFSDQLNEIAATNAPALNEAIANVRSSTETLQALLDDLQSGRGLAGALLRDQQLATNVSVMINNLAITSSNLNRLGLWGILWKPRAARTNAVPKSVYTGRSPFN